MSQLEKGDVVELRSGGPRTTVTMKAPVIGGVCQWFEGQKVSVATFPEEALRVVADPEEQHPGAAPF